MGTSYSTLVGSPPSMLTYDWVRWYHKLVRQRIAECPLARATTYYFSQSGDDSTGDGSIATPWKTIAKAQAVHDAGSGNVALLFKRGDEWRETTGLSITKNNVTVADYGLAVGVVGKPFFNRFTIDYLDASNPWTNASGDRWTTSEASTIAWLREKADRYNPLRMITTTGATGNTDVENTPRSWRYESGTLHINPGTGVDPNTKDYEAVIANGVSGVDMDGDFGRVQNIRAEGWGMNPADTNNQKHGIRVSGNTTKSNLVIGCESYYTSAHSIAFNGGGNPADSGGFSTFVNCKAGFAIQHSSGETIYNSYVYDGGQETIFHECEARWGTLPQGTATYAPRAASHYQHTNGVTSAALTIAYRCSAPTSTWTCRKGVRFEDYAGVTTLTSVRNYIFGEVFNDGLATGTGSDQDIAYGGTARANSRISVKPSAYTASPTGLTASSKKQNGWAFNTILIYDLANQTTHTAAVWNGLNTEGENAKLYNCMIRVQNNPGTAGFVIDGRLAQSSSQSDADSGELKNSIVQMTSGGSASSWVAFNGNGTLMVRNAYSVDTLNDGTLLRRYSVDTAGVHIGGAEDYDTQPTAASPLYQLGTPTVGLEYDYDLRPRDPDAPSIGPREPGLFSLAVYDIASLMDDDFETHESAIVTALGDGSVTLASVDGITDLSFREAVLAYIGGKSTLVDNGNGTKTITYKKQNGTTAKLAITFDTSGQWTATTVS